MRCYGWVKFKLVYFDVPRIDYHEFSDDYIEKSESANDYIDWNTLKNMFDKWYETNYHKAPPNAKDMKLHFSNNIFKCPIKQIRIPSSGSICYGWKDFKLICDDQSSNSVDFDD